MDEIEDGPAYIIGQNFYLGPRQPVDPGLTGLIPAKCRQAGACSCGQCDSGESD